MVQLKDGQSVIEYSGVKMLAGINTHPGSGTVHQHWEEHNLFNKVLGRVTSPVPKMIEVGCFWALWSLLFRQRFPQGESVLVELGRRHLDVGEENFRLNGWDFKSYHGGFFLGESGTFKNRAADLEYDKVSDEIITGPELDFDLIVKDCGREFDVLHLDIQGSELKFLSMVLNKARFNNIVVATHSTFLHSSTKSLLTEHSYEIREECRYGTVGGDGYLACNRS